MKAISTEAILTSVRTRNDNSLSLTLVSPELAPAEMLAFIECRNRNLKVIFQPVGEDIEALIEVKSELDEKTPSQRLRAVLFVLWKQENEAVDFEVFYRQKMNGIIEHLKLKLQPV